ncbi:MAG: GTP cyclohydrolase II [Brevinema sp.]
MFFTTVHKAVSELSQGNPILLINNKQDGLLDAYMIFSAELITIEKIDFIKKYTNQIIMVPIDKEIAESLSFSSKNRIDYPIESYQIKDLEVQYSSTSMIQCMSIKKICANSYKKEDFCSDGSIFPIIVDSHKEYEVKGDCACISVDLSKWADLAPVSVIAILNPAISNTITHLYDFARNHHVKMISTDLVHEYRLTINPHVIREVSTLLPTKYGEFRVYGYYDELTKENHIAFVKGNINCDKPILTRIHSECLTGDLFGSERCDCGDQLEKAMRMIQSTNEGILVYMRQENRGIGVINKIKSYVLQDMGHDTIEANTKLGISYDKRNFNIAARILKNLNVKKVELMTNNPQKIKAIEQERIEVVRRIPLQSVCTDKNIITLKTKKEKMNHLLDI